MSRPARFAALACAAWLALAATSPAQASIIVNGGFETGFASWVRADQLGSDGTFFLQSGLASLLNGDPVPARYVQDYRGDERQGRPRRPRPVPGLRRDARQPDLELRSLRRQPRRSLRHAASLDFALTNPNGALTLNQQVRVDLLRTGADPFSVAAADVLLSLYASQVGDSLVSSYGPSQVTSAPARRTAGVAPASLRRDRQPGAAAARRRQRRHRRQHHSRAGIDGTARGRSGGTVRAAVPRRAG